MIALLLDDQPPSYAVGDVPSDPIVFGLDTTASWDAVESSHGTAAIDGTMVTLTLGTLDTAGLVTVQLAATTTGGKRETCEPLQFIVEDLSDGWLTLDQVRTDWADAPDDDVTLYRLLASARRDCLRFNVDADPASETTTPDDAEGYRQAQLLQVRGRWAASRATGASQIGDDQTNVTVFPMDWQVKQLLRPHDPSGGMW